MSLAFFRRCFSYGRAETALIMCRRRLFLRRPNLQPVPEKPQRDPILSMATKRVLDGPALSGRDDGNSDDHDHRNDQTDYTQDNTAARLRDEEPIDVFNPVRKEEGTPGGGGGFSLAFVTGRSSGDTPPPPMSLGCCLLRRTKVPVRCCLFVCAAFPRFVLVPRFHDLF